MTKTQLAVGTLATGVLLAGGALIGRLTAPTPAPVVAPTSVVATVPVPVPSPTVAAPRPPRPRAMLADVARAWGIGGRLDCRVVPTLNGE